jgi:hypothetical protein
MIVEYKFTMGDGLVHHFAVNVGRAPAQPATSHPPAPWTALAFHQCANCPLQPEAHPHCPVALDLEEITARFRAVSAFESVTVEVKTPERTYVKYCDSPTGLRALLGLVMASSACPITGRLKALSYYHLPFANAEETLFRAVSDHLLRQYFIQKAGGAPDLQLAGLRQLYADLAVVNAAFEQRLRAAGERDSNIAALINLNFLSATVAISLDEALARLKPRFAATLERPRP